MNLLCKGETVTAGLRRLGGGKKKQNKTWKRSKVYDLEADEEEDTAKSKTISNFSQLWLISLRTEIFYHF